MTTYFIAPAPPCSNGKLHLGHIGGVYLLADIFTRFQKMNGHQAYYITGADEHGSYTLVKALKLGKAVESVSDYYCTEIEKCLQSAGISCDIFVRTSSEEHQQNARDIFQHVFNNGFIEIKNTEQLYCEYCQEFITGSLAIGNCPSCGNSTDSNLCEKCGEAIQHTTLHNPQHTTCGNSLDLRFVPQAHLRLDLLKTNLKQSIKDSAWPDWLKHMEEHWLDNRCRNLSMTRHFHRGVKVSQESLENQVLLTWFEGLWCYLTGIRNICEREGKRWEDVLNNPDTRVVMFMGQDNRFYYSVGVSAILLAYGIKQIPHNLSIQNFYKLEGDKFSTSRNHALWADEVMENVQPESIRYYLSSIASQFGKDCNDFKLEGLKKTISFLMRIEKVLRNYLWGKVIMSDHNISDNPKILLEQYETGINNLQFWDAIQTIQSFYLQYVELITEQISEDENSLRIAIFLAMLQPIIPQFSKRYGKAFFGDTWQQHESIIWYSIKSATSLVRVTPEEEFPALFLPLASSFEKEYYEQFSCS